MPTSLDYTAMQEYSKRSAHYVIQDILDEPDFPYKSKGKTSGPESIPISQVAGFSFYMNEFLLQQ